MADLMELEAEVGSEKFDMESLHFEKDAGGGLSREVTSGVDKSPADEEEEE